MRSDSTAPAGSGVRLAKAEERPVQAAGWTSVS
jgi:hypothetical protein